MTSPSHKAKIEAKEFWVEKFNGFKNPTYYAWAEKPEKLSMIKIKIDDGDPIAASEYFHVIEHKAYASALDDIRLLVGALEDLQYNIEKLNIDVGDGPLERAIIARRAIQEKYPEMKK